MFQQFLQQLKTGLKVAQEVIPLNPSDYSRIIFCGMGGSIIPAEAVSMLWLDDINGYINRTPYLPHWASKKDLAVCVSWSGDTEETILAYREAKKKKLDVAVITSGGKLAELAQKDQTPLILLPNSGLASRNAFGLMFSALLTLLSYSDIIESNLNFSFDTGEPEALAEKLVDSINTKTPLIYSSYSWRYLGNFWKRFFNENCKIHAFSNFTPEAMHNEIVPILACKNRGSSIRQDESGPANSCNFFPIILRDSTEEQNDIQLINKFTKFLKSRNVNCFVSEIQGKNRFEKIIGQYALASLTSQFLAKKLGVDPEDTSIIENFKKLS